MTKIRLADGTALDCESVELSSGTLSITTKERTVEELANIFMDKEKTSSITLLTESGKESGYKTGFTSFAGISYGTDGMKTVELFQPKDAAERRLSNAEGTANAAEAAARKAGELAEEVRANLDAAVTEITTAMAAALKEGTEGV